VGVRARTPLARVVSPALSATRSPGCGPRTAPDPAARRGAGCAHGRSFVAGPARKYAVDSGVPRRGCRCAKSRGIAARFVRNSFERRPCRPCGRSTRTSWTGCPRHIGGSGSGSGSGSGRLRQRGVLRGDAAFGTATGLCGSGTPGALRGRRQRQPGARSARPSVVGMLVVGGAGRSAGATTMRVRLRLLRLPAP